MNIFKIKLFLALFLIKIIGILSISNGANEPIEMTQGGLMTRDCALSHCDTKDSLGLWLSLQNVCSGQNANPYFLEINSQETIYDNNYSQITSAYICSITSILSLLLGYIVANHYYKKVVYMKVKEDDYL